MRPRELIGRRLAEGDLVAQGADRAVSPSEPPQRPCVGSQQLERANRLQRQKSGQDPCLGTFSHHGDAPVASGVLHFLCLALDGAIG